MTKARSLLRNFWEKWKRFGRRMGDLQARFLLFIFYFGVLGPFSLLLRWGRIDPLGIKPTTPRGWSLKDDHTDVSIERAMKQF